MVASKPIKGKAETVQLLGSNFPLQHRSMDSFNALNQVRGTPKELMALKIVLVRQFGDQKQVGKVL